MHLTTNIGILLDLLETHKKAEMSQQNYNCMRTQARPSPDTTHHARTHARTHTRLNSPSLLSHLELISL